MKPNLLNSTESLREVKTSHSLPYTFGRKFLRLFFGLTHCSIALLCAKDVLHVAGNNLNDQQMVIQVDNSDVIFGPQLPTTTLTPQYISIDSRNHHSRENLLVWAMISKYQLWANSIIIIISIPVLIHSLILMLTRYRRSNYFDFMTSIIVVDLIMLITIISHSLTIDVPFSSQWAGSLICKLTSFFTNFASGYVNWLWVMMFCQRFSHIYHSMHRSKNGSFSIFEDSRKLLIGTGIVSAVTQLWVPFIMNDMPVLSTDGNATIGTFCGADTTLMDEKALKWISLAQSFWLYIMPFLITVFTDFAAVLIFTRESKWFTTVSSQAIKQSDGQMPLSLKIQSEESIVKANKRRRFAVRRCLALATTQLFLNLPQHLLQLIDEWSNLRNNSDIFVIYLYADALFYLFYLIQFPMIAVFVRLLHSNVDGKSRRRSQNRRQRQFGEDARSSTTTTNIELRNKRSSRELESLAAHRHSRISLQNSHQL